MNNEIYLKAKQLALKLFEENNYDVLSTGIGFKRIKGQLINVKCITFGVKNKLPLSSISPDKIIPSSFIIDGETVFTDVYEESSFSIQPSYCFNSGDQSVPPNVPPPVSLNRLKTRPLSGGVSGAAPPVNGFVNAGTLGGVVVDLFDGTIVGMTNCHVGASPGGTDYQASVALSVPSTSTASISTFTYGARASAYQNINFYQPSSWDSGIVENPSDLVGAMKRAMPVRLPPGINKLDVCLINLSDDIVSSNSWFPLSAPFNSPPDFATSEDINNITLNDPIFKSGRTLGPLGNDTSSCDLRLTNNSMTIGVIFDDVMLYTDLLRIESPYTNNYVSSGGDSGSFVYACLSSTMPSASAWKIIGLHFAGSGTIGAAIRIDNIASMFSVSAYKGDYRSATPPLCSYKILPYTTYSTAVSAFKDGKTYWPLGRV